MKAKIKKRQTEKAAKASAPTTPPETHTLPPVVAASRKGCAIATSDLLNAPWNPRPKITPESVADLAASIRTVGIIEPLVVMAGGTPGKYIIIAGHRRLEAARAVGLDSVPCDVLVGVDEASARRMTFIENLQRQDTDPLLESSLVNNLITDGMSLAEIAAETGRGEKWVARRLNLSKLSPSWRKRIEKGEDITTDCLEHIAAYPEAIQEKMKREWLHHVSALRWDDIKRCFGRESLDLSTAPFDITPCKTCLNNTGCSPDLFDWEGKPKKLGKCLCEKCYKKKVAAYFDAIVKQAESDGALIVRREPGYYVATSTHQTRKCSALYVYKSYSGESRVEWGEPPKKENGSKTSEKEYEKQLAEKREKREHNKAIRTLSTWCATDGNLAKLLADYFRDPLTGEILPHAPFYVAAAFAGIGSYNLLGSDTYAGKGGIAAIFGNLHIPAGWANVVADQIVRYLDPGRSQGYYANPNANLILAMFPSVREAIGEDVASRIISTAAADTLRCPAIKWTASKALANRDADDEAQPENAK